MLSENTALSILRTLNNSPRAGVALRREAMTLLDQLPDYDWSGVYRLEGQTLLLDEYVGAETDHNRIPVGVGVCGTAVAEDQNQVISDVRDLTNYLSCSAKTRSEIVVLIKDEHGSILGQIDVDGHRVGAFDSSDEHLLSRVAEVLAARWE